VNFAPHGNLSELPESDLALLRKWGIKLKFVESVWDRFLENGATKLHDPQRAKEKSVMYNKIFAWEMVEYDWVQYVDADVMPIGNMDAYFTNEPRTTFTRGWMSPLQGAWYLLKPDLKTFNDLAALVKHRYSEKWDPRRTFDLNGERSAALSTKAEKERPCLDDDQGLFWCYFRYSSKSPPMNYVEHKNAKVNFVQTIEKARVTSEKRGGGSFKFLFEHFGGRYKPWRVCVNPATVRNLKAISAQHAHHWPSTKYASFQLYCKTFNELNLEPLVAAVALPLK